MIHFLRLRHVWTLTHHANHIEDVSVAVDHDAHRHEETGQEEEEDEGGVVGVLGRPVQRTAQPVDLQGVAVPAQKRSSGPGQRVEPDVADGPPCPGEVHHLSVDHADVALVGQGSQAHDGDDAWGREGGGGRGSVEHPALSNVASPGATCGSRSFLIWPAEP